MLIQTDGAILTDSKFLGHLEGLSNVEQEKVSIARQAADLWHLTTSYLPQQFGPPSALRVTQRKYKKRADADEKQYFSYYERSVTTSMSNSMFAGEVTVPNPVTAVGMVTNIDVLPIGLNQLCVVEYYIRNEKSRRPRQAQTVHVEEETETSDEKTVRMESSERTLKESQAKNSDSSPSMKGDESEPEPPKFYTTPPHSGTSIDQKRQGLHSTTDDVTPSTSERSSTHIGTHTQSYDASQGDRIGYSPTKTFKNATATGDT